MKKIKPSKRRRSTKAKRKQTDCGKLSTPVNPTEDLSYALKVDDIRYCLPDMFCQISLKKLYRVSDILKEVSLTSSPT